MGVVLEGKSTHASMPDKGENAIYKAVNLINTLREIRFDRDPLMGRTTFNVCLIQGGTAPNIVPDKCEVVIDIRYVREEDKKKILEMMKKYGKIDIHLDLGPFKSNPDFSDEIYNKIKKVNPGTKKVLLPYYTEAGILAEVTDEVVIFGPGDPSLAHSSNEYILAEDLRKAKEIYSVLLRSS